MILDAIVYGLCALTCVMCAALLYRGYFRTKMRLLLWSALSFSLLALSSIVLYIDYLVIAYIDFAPYRLILSATAGVVLLFGLISETVT